MPNSYKKIQGEFADKWLGSSVDYTFLQLPPSYYLDGSGYASWYDKIADTTQELQRFSNQQQKAIHFLLEVPNSSKIVGDYANNVDYRVSFGDVINLTFNEEIQDGNDVGAITFINAKLDTGKPEEGIGFVPTLFGLLGERNSRGDINPATAINDVIPRPTNNGVIKLIPDNMIKF